MTTPMSLAFVAWRDRLVVLLSLLAVVALAWVYLAGLAREMGGMVGPTGAMTGIPAAWTTQDLVLLSVMWGVMMVGMMLPGASPMIMMFVRINRKHRAEDEPFVPTGIFVGGYVAVWWSFSLAAAALQWGLQGFGLLSPVMAGVGGLPGGLVLIAAGLYQWSPLKHTCLRHCQTPLGFLMTGWRDGMGGAFRMGLVHGSYCVGCCWVLMLLLFVGGVMNLLWVAVLAAFVLMEKVAPPGSWLPRATGALLILWGGQTIASAF